MRTESPKWRSVLRETYRTMQTKIWISDAHSTYGGNPNTHITTVSFLWWSIKCRSFKKKVEAYGSWVSTKTLFTIILQVYAKIKRNCKNQASLCDPIEYKWSVSPRCAHSSQNRLESHCDATVYSLTWQTDRQLNALNAGHDNFKFLFDQPEWGCRGQVVTGVTAQAT